MTSASRSASVGAVGLVMPIAINAVLLTRAAIVMWGRFGRTTSDPARPCPSAAATTLGI